MTVHQRMQMRLAIVALGVSFLLLGVVAAFAEQLPFNQASTRQTPPACTTCPPGPPGKDGKDGLPGRDGRDGTDGVDGKDGVPGKDGRDGKDGVCTACGGSWTPGPIHFDGVLPFALPPDMQFASIVQPNRRWDLVGFSPLFQAMLIIDRANNRFIAFDRSSPKEAYWRWMVPTSPNSIGTFGDSYVYPGKAAFCDVDIPKLIALASKPGRMLLNWTSFGAVAGDTLASYIQPLPEAIWREAEREVQP